MLIIVSFNNSTRSGAMQKLENNIEKKWYVLCTKPLKEKIVYKLLFDREFEVSLPLKEKKIVTQKGIRIKKTPILSGYVFVNCLRIDIEKLRYIEGSTKFLQIGGKYQFLSDKDIEFLNNLVQNNVSFEITEQFKIGEYVEIVGGVLNGIKGYIDKINTKRYIVIKTEVSFINLKIELDKQEIKKADL